MAGIGLGEKGSQVSCQVRDLSWTKRLGSGLWALLLRVAGQGNSG